MSLHGDAHGELIRIDFNSNNAHLHTIVNLSVRFTIAVKCKDENRLLKTNNFQTILLVRLTILVL